MHKLLMNNGESIEIIGTGTNTFGKVNHRYSEPLSGDLSDVTSAVKAGYRMFDTAASYRTEAVVGEGLKQSGVPREEIFITTKFPGRQPEPEYTETEATIRQTIDNSFNELGTDYIDLYLLHHPWEDQEKILQVWQILEEYVDQGKIKSLGVSNYDEELLTFLIDNTRIKPVLNQIESHPGHWNDDLVAFTQEQGLIAQAWGPLTKVSEAARETLAEIGQKYGKTWAQIALKYNIQRDVAIIPKSHNFEHQQANLDIFDFELTEQEQALIQTL